MWVSTHSHPKVAATTIHALENPNEVSTHSHPKVAASRSALSIGLQTCFNTQPPEGGCKHLKTTTLQLQCFNTQPPEGGCMPHLLIEAA